MSMTVVSFLRSLFHGTSAGLGVNDEGTSVKVARQLEHVAVKVDGVLRVQADHGERLTRLEAAVTEGFAASSQNDMELKREIGTVHQTLAEILRRLPPA
jgi:hypothetical protein